MYTLYNLLMWIIRFILLLISFVFYCFAINTERENIDDIHSLKPEFHENHAYFAGVTYLLPQTDENYSFTMLARINDSSAKLTVDSSQKIGSRVKILKMLSGNLSQEITELKDELEQRPLEEIWCSDFLALIGDDIKVESRQGSSVIYSFSPIPTEDSDEDDKEFLSHMQAKIKIDGNSGAIMSVELKNTDSFRPILFAKITTFNMLVTCQRFQQRDRVKKVTTKVEGSLGFKDFNETESTEILSIKRINTQPSIE